MHKPWKDYAGAVERLKAVTEEEPTLTRNRAQEVIGIAPSVFGKQVISNCMWIAKNRTDLKRYQTRDLIRHFERMRDRVEPARLLYDRYALSDEAFEERYVAPKMVVFAKGTNLSVGGEN